MFRQTKGKLDDEEDEGVAQNSSIEEGESIQSSVETEKQGDKPAAQEVTDTKGLQYNRTEELLNGVDDKIINAPVDKNRKSSLKDVKGQSLDGPTERSELSEEEKRKKTYDAEMKSWLQERIEAPIPGTNFF